jgi:hypothetical protein
MVYFGLHVFCATFIFTIITVDLNFRVGEHYPAVRHPVLRYIAAQIAFYRFVQAFLYSTTSTVRANGFIWYSQVMMGYSDHFGIAVKASDSQRFGFCKSRHHLSLSEIGRFIVMTGRLWTKARHLRQ